jgi:hypothetical protein
MWTEDATGDSPAETDLSFAEEQLWLAEQAGPAALPFVDCAPGLSIVVRLENALNRRALEDSLTDIVRRHDVLRSRFMVREGRPVRLSGQPSRLRLTTIDLRRACHDERFDVARQVLARQVTRRFDLARGRLLRAVLVVLADDEHILAITVHHIAFDRWSKRVLSVELGQLYEAYATGRTPGLEPLPALYRDYVQWQRDRLDGRLGRELIDYWTARLSGLGDLVLPCDGDHGPIASTRSGTWWFAIPAEDTSRLVVMSRRWRVTITTVLLAVFMLLLHRLSGQDDIAVGVPLSDRRHPDFEHLIGLFMNVVVVRTTISPGMTFLNLLDRVRHAIVDACRYQDMPYGYLSKVMQAQRPLYRVVFNFMPTIPASALELHGLHVEPVEIDADREALADVSLHVHHKSGALACRLAYKADVFSSGWIRDFAEQFQTLVTAILNPCDEHVAPAV